MPRILVSIISDQTIPNLLVIRELEGEYDAQLFISTQKMEREGKSGWIENAAGLEQNSVPRIVVNENKWSDIEQKLRDFPFLDDASFIVNLTGGTKIVSLVVFRFFTKPNNRILYSPIGKNEIEELYPDPGAIALNLSYRLSVLEYFRAFGLSYTSNNVLSYPRNHTFSFFDYCRAKEFFFPRISKIMRAQLLESPKDRTYYAGRWFEEYVFLLIKERFNLPDNHMELTVKLFRSLNDTTISNEFDVVFTKDNALYVIECKVSIGSKVTVKDKMEYFLYKLGAITRDFGLSVHSCIFTLSDISRLAGSKMDSIKRRREVLGIKAIIDASCFKKSSCVMDILNSM